VPCGALPPMNERRRPPSPRPSSARKPTARRGSSDAPRGRSASSGPRNARPTTPVPTPKRRPKPGSDRSILWRWRRGLFLVGLVGVAATGGVAAVVLNIELPPTDPLLQTSFVCAADVTEACGPQNAIATFSAEEDRINVPLAELPDDLVHAVLATEDRDYYRHGGVDPVGIGRALYQDVRGSGVSQGGSTITQQYVKNVYLTSERSVVRKVKEAILAVKLERELDKDEILERYLNTIYFGRGAYGVGAAARAYYGKDVRELGVLESSYLAGLIRSPTSADPLTNPEEAARRRSTVLVAMVEEGYITATQQAEVEALPIATGVQPPNDRTGLGVVKGADMGTEYFVEAVRRQVADEFGEDTLYGGGLRIYTTIDFDMQRAAWDAVTSTLDEPDDPAAALVAVDEYGYVKAMVGGTDFRASQVNLALGAAAGGSGRGAGSSFKPFVLARAIQEGVSLNSKFEAPGQMTFPKANAGEDWVVNNYGGTEQGVLDLVDATRVSSNTAYAQLMLEVGSTDAAAMANSLGVSADLPQVASLVLGTGEVSPLDMAAGYSTFANRGIRNEPTMIARIEQVDEDGGVRIVDQPRPTGERVLTEQEADLVTYCLQTVVEDGTGTAAAFGKPAAGKTGTTQDNKDAWFVGYTPTLTAAVWMGYPDVNADGDVPTMKNVHGLPGVTGGSLPAEIWRKFMTAATEGTDTGTFSDPTSFPGTELNEELEVTTTTEATSSTSSTSSSSTTETTAPPSTETTEPTTSSTTSSTSSSTTTTTGPPGPN
jgi:penicillin-binding protein 1A